ncbi:MAG TPA: DUF4160 domain-containing protein [Candidatus Dwaynia gallinarum]|nr:DUF4160 domain-containing protein [Candidatus Dwaynia gallinarum]
MPVISSFFGIIIRMNFREHNPPHLHAEYQGNNAVFNFDGEITEGTMPNKQKKLIVAWIEIHKDELIANWQLIQNKEDYFKIDPLR